MITARRISWPDFSTCNSTTNQVTAINDHPQLPSTSETSVKDRNSTDSFTAWSLNSFTAIIPSSPSPNCSSFSPLTNISCSPASDFFYSQISPSVFSSPLHKGSRWSDVSKISASASEENEEKRNNSNDLHALYLQNKDFDEEEVVKEEINPANAQCMSYSTEYRSFDGCQPLAVLPLHLPAVIADEDGEEEEEGEKEEEEEMEERRDGGVSGNSSKESELTENSSLNAHQTLIARPKPYYAFLEEIKKRELEDEVDAWEESKHSKLMNKLQKKEDVITRWELKRTRQATLRMKKTECRLERKRAKAFIKMQKKIGNVQMKAEEKKAKERHATGKRICQVSRFAQKIKYARSRIWLRFFCFF